MSHRPFIDALAMHDSWYWLLIPMAVGVSLVYKAIRMPSLRGYTRAVAIMTTQIVVGMILLGAASFVVVVVYARYLAEWLAGG